MSGRARIWAESPGKGWLMGSWQAEAPTDRHWAQFPRQAHYVRADLADGLAEAAVAVVNKITRSMEGSVDGDYVGGAMYFNDPEIRALGVALTAYSATKAEGSQ